MSQEQKVQTGPNEVSVGLTGSAPPKEETKNKPPQAVNSAAEIPEWERIGWKRVSEFGEPRSDKKSQYEEILKELYYNDLWTYSGVVIVSLFTTWFIVLCGGNLGWILVLCAFVATYLKNSVNRFYRNAKSDISRKIAREKLEEDDEKVEWLNEFLRRFWLIYEPVLSESIIQIADTVLSASTPGFLDSLKLTNFTLGTKSPVIESIRSYPKNADDEVVMDWKVNFDPNDLAEMTKAQLVKRVNPKVILTVRVGRGFVGAGIPILLENMSFTGLLRVKLKLIPNFPHVETISFCFLEEPTIDYALKPIGGETLGFDIGIVPGLSKFIKDQVHASLRPMMYAPNTYTLITDYLLNGFPIESSIGVLKLTMKNAKSLRNAETFGTSDPYCKVLLISSDITVAGKELSRTKYISNSLNPVWDETHYLLFNNLKDTLKFQIYDSNGTLNSDTLLGDNTYPLSTFVEKPNQSNSTIPVMHNGKQKGELNFDAVWYPIVKTKKDEPVPETNVGILKFNLHQAKDLDPKLSMVGVYNPYVELKYNGKLVFRSKTFRRSNNPTWEEFFEIFMTDKKRASLELNIRDERDFAEDPIVGSWNMNVEEFIRLSEESKIDWFDVHGARSGKVRLSCQWKPVILDHIPENSAEPPTVEPFGIVKLHIKKATDIKNVEQLRGKSDPYIRIMLNSIYRGRTNVRHDNLNPIWDEYFYIPVHALEEKLFLRCFDYESYGNDRYLGITELEIKDLIKKSDDGIILPAETINTVAPFKDTKGSLFYSASFHPILIRKGDKEEENKEENTNVLEHQSGILIININQAKFKKKRTHIEVFVDNDTSPVYDTQVSDSFELHWGEDADVFINELNSSKIILDIKQSSSKSIGKVEFNVKQLLEKCLKDNGNIWLPVAGMDNSTINIGLKYIPVKYNSESHEPHVSQESQESHENIKDNEPHPESSNKIGHAASAITDGVSKVGSRLGLLKKKDKNEHKKSEEEKITEKVDNKQEEDKEEPIPPNPQENPTTNHVETNQEENQKLEKTNGIKPYDVDFKKDNPKQEEESKESDTRHIEFKEETENLRRERKQDEGSRSSEENVDNNQPNRFSTYDSGEIVGEPGTLTITVVKAKDLIAASDGGKTSNSYVKVKMNGKKEILKTSVVKKSTSPEWNKRVTLDITGSQVSFLFYVRDHNLLSKDVELGEYTLNLWDHIKPEEYIKDMWVPLSKGNSKLHIKLDFVPTSTRNSGSDRTSDDNVDGSGVASKFSIRRKK
ncbi:transmembrane protein [Rhizophagus clarus]|uniref:Transmembrane protein n=1 Tax=Rhizophagus clarus TaxID=94130 RepID=A0A8H3LHK0_9GLOM|nr:transmembrane protein [Rhizophagus clarus]